MIDNYDSFTYNLVHIIEKVQKEKVNVFRNDKITLEDVKKYDKIILSPGPGVPADAGIMPSLIKEYAPSKSIFGVCLGMQAMGEVFGGKLENLGRVYHGVAMPVIISKEDNLFKDCPKTFLTGRYHSWIVSETQFPEELEVIATDDEKHIMALRHKKYDVKGVQFHPESILTEHGETIIKNWLNA